MRDDPDRQREALPPILIIKSGSASRDDLRLCRKAGVIVLQVKDPSDVRYIEAPLPRLQRLPAIAIRLVREMHAQKSGYIEPQEVRKKLLDAFMADEQPDEPKKPEGKQP